MNKDNMTAPEAATITEKELWAIFVGHTLKTTFSMGPTVESYCPADYVSDPGSYGFIGDLSSEVETCLAHEDEPENTLNLVIDDLTNYLELLKTVRVDFSRVKESLTVDEEEDDNGPVLYRMPHIMTEAAA